MGRGPHFSERSRQYSADRRTRVGFHEPGEGNAIFGSGIPLTVEKGYGLVDLRIGLLQDQAHMADRRVQSKDSLLDGSQDLT